MIFINIVIPEIIILLSFLKQQKRLKSNSDEKQRKSHTDVYRAVLYWRSTVRFVSLWMKNLSKKFLI